MTAALLGPSKYMTFLHLWLWILLSLFLQLTATLHMVYYFKNGCLLKHKTKACLVFSVELKQTEADSFYSCTGDQ